MGTDVSKTVGSVLPGGFCFLHEVAGESEAGGGPIRTGDWRRWLQHRLGKGGERESQQKEEG